MANILNKQTVIGHNVTMTINCHFSCVKNKRKETNVGTQDNRKRSITVHQYRCDICLKLLLIDTATRFIYARYYAKMNCDLNIYHVIF